MKKIFLYIIGFLIVLGFAITNWYFGRILNYKLSYESMVKETCKVEIEKALEEKWGVK